MAKRKTAAEKRREAEAAAEAAKQAEEVGTKLNDEEGKNSPTEETLSKEVNDSDEEQSTEDTESDAGKDKKVETTEHKPLKEKTIDVKSPAFANKVVNESKIFDDLIKSLDGTILDGDASTLRRIVETYRTKRGDANKKDIVNNNYSLYRLINSVLEEGDYELFVLRYKLLNKAFLLEKKDVLGSLSLSRYDYLWTWSTKTHKVYHMMVELISETCDPSKRNETLKVIDIENNSRDLSDKARQNLIRFYK